MEKQIQPNKLFLASCLALTTTAMAFAIRAGLLPVWRTQFNLTGEELGWISGTAFWGFTLAMLFGGPLVDYIGMKRLLIIAFIGHLAGTAMTIFANDFWSLYFSTLLVGIANGGVEAACNPLVAALYPQEKTKMLNRFHVWFPGGIVIGGLVSYFFSDMGMKWEYQMAAMLVPTILYGIIIFGQKFPQTERVSSGISTSDMFKACLSPLFLFMVFCMLLTAVTELGTGQWIGELLGNTGVSAILVLVFINGLMAIGRLFAGPVIHKLAPQGMLLYSAILGTIGLLWLSVSTGNMTFAAAAVFAAGVCFFWPTMIGFVAENVPKSGALGMSIMGGAAMLCISFILPVMGKFYDAQTAASIPQGYTLEALQAAVLGSPEADLLSKAKLAGGSATLRYVAILPFFLIFAFTGLVFYKKRAKTSSNEPVLANH